MRASEIRKGTAVIIDGKLFVVTGADHNTPGNLRAKVQFKLRDVAKGTIQDKRVGATDDIETDEWRVADEIEQRLRDRHRRATIGDGDHVDAVYVHTIVVGMQCDRQTGTMQRDRQPRGLGARAEHADIAWDAAAQLGDERRCRVTVGDVSQVTGSDRETLRKIDRTDDDEHVHTASVVRGKYEGPATMPPGPRSLH